MGIIVTSTRHAAPRMMYDLLSTRLRPSGMKATVSALAVVEGARINVSIKPLECPSLDSSTLKHALQWDSSTSPDSFACGLSRPPRAGAAISIQSILRGGTAESASSLARSQSARQARPSCPVWMSGLAGRLWLTARWAGARFKIRPLIYSNVSGTCAIGGIGWNDRLRLEEVCPEPIRCRHDGFWHPIDESAGLPGTWLTLLLGVQSIQRLADHVIHGPVDGRTTHDVLRGRYGRETRGSTGVPCRETALRSCGQDRAMWKSGQAVAAVRVAEPTLTEFLHEQVRLCERASFDLLEPSHIGHGSLALHLEDGDGRSQRDGVWILLQIQQRILGRTARLTSRRRH